MRALLALGLTLALSTPALAIEQPSMGGPIFIGKDWPVRSTCCDTHGWHKPDTAPTDRPFLAWCPDATIPFTVVKWSKEFSNFVRIDTRGLTADFAFWMELPEGPPGDRSGK